MANADDGRNETDRAGGTAASDEESRSVGLVVAGRVVNGLLVIALIVILTRLLDKHTFGLFFIVFTLYEGILALGTVGLPASLLYFAPQAKDDESRALGFGTGIALLVFAAPMALALVLLAGPIAHAMEEPLVGRLLPYLGVFILLDFPGQMMANHLLGRRRYNGSVLITLGFNIGLFLSLVVPAVLGWSIEALMLCFVVVGAGRFAVFLCWFLFVEREGPLRPQVAMLKRQLRFGIPLFFDNLVGQLNRYLDKYFIMFAFSVEVFAVYNVASRELPLVGMLPYALTAALMPRLVVRFKEQHSEEFLALWHAAMTKMAVIMMPIAVYFLAEGQDFLAVAFTDDYASGQLVFRIYLLLLPLRLCSYGGVVQTMGATKEVLRASVYGLLTNVVLNYPMLKLVGPPGAATASVVAQLVAVGYLLSTIRRRLDIPWSRVFPSWPVLRALGLALLAGLPLVGLALLDLAPALRLALAAGLYLPLYLFVTARAGLLTSEDLVYLKRLVLFWRS